MPFQTPNRIDVDADLSQRPGVPAEHNPAPVANAHWITPEKQMPEGSVLKDPSRDELTATFGTAQPPRLVSGAIRRAAYRIPDYYARRWLFLIMADRIDAIESAIERVTNLSR